MAVTDEAILKIKSMIVAGEVRPGDRLPPEKELSERLGLSRSSMREAIKALEVIRVLDVRQGDGTYVTSLEPHLLLEALTFVVDLHDDASVLDILAVRRILEPAATFLAAGKVGETDIESLLAQVEAVDPAAGVEDLVTHDIKFHSSIVSLSGNSYLAGLVDSLSGSTVRARIWRGLTQESAVTRTLAEHRAIVEALADGDGKLAEALSLAHIAGVEEWLRRWAGQDQPSA